MAKALRNTEEELVGHLQSADRARFGLLYDHFSPALYGVVLKIVSNEKVAEDIIQETFIKVWSNASAYNSDKSRLFTWMLNIARNTAIDYLRSTQGIQRKNTVPVYKAEEKLADQEVMTHKDIGLSRIINELKKDHFEVITLSFFEGYTQAEIAEKLNIPLGTVKTRCRQALKNLRAILEINQLREGQNN